MDCWTGKSAGFSPLRFLSTYSAAVSELVESVLGGKLDDQVTVNHR